MTTAIKRMIFLKKSVFHLLFSPFNYEVNCLNFFFSGQPFLLINTGFMKNHFEFHCSVLSQFLGIKYTKDQKVVEIFVKINCGFLKLVPSYH